MTPDPREARPVTPDEREQFEASCKADPEWDWDLTIIDRTGDYRNDCTYAGWCMWQASRASRSARIAALEAALRELLAAIDASARGDPDRDAVANMMRIADAEVAARAALAGDAT